MVAIALFMIIAVIFIKYQFVCEVTVDGEKLGYVTDKEQFEQSVNEIINREEENKLFTTIAKMPEYHFKFVDKTESTNSEEILAKIESSAETTYKIYAVTIDGKEKVKVANLEEAESLVKKLNKKYEKEIEKINGILNNLDKHENKKENIRILNKKWIENFEMSGNINKLDRDIIMELIDFIEIYENKKITIHFKFMDEINEFIDDEKNKKEIDLIKKVNLSAVC